MGREMEKSEEIAALKEESEKVRCAAIAKDADTQNQFESLQKTQREELLRLEDQISELRKQLDAAADIETTRTDELARLQEQLEKADEVGSQVTAQVEAASDARAELERLRVQRAEEKLSLEVELETLRNQVSALQKQLEESSCTDAQSSQASIELERLRALQIEEKQHREAEAEAFRNQVLHLQKQLDESSHNAAQRNEEHAALREELDTVRRSVSNAESSSDSQAELERLRVAQADEKRRMEADRDALCNELSQLQKRLEGIAVAEAECIRLRAEVSKSREECENLRVENAGLECDIVELARMLTELKAAVQRYAGYDAACELHCGA